MMLGLRTWWSGAVATTSLTLHVAPASLAAGAAGTLVAAMLCIWWTLRGLARVSERSLLAGQLNVAQPFRAARRLSGRPEGLRNERRLVPLITAIVFGALGLALMTASATG